MKDLINYIAQALVDHPEQVSVKEVEGDQTSVLELTVAKEDIGKVIGKQGRTARAMRTILSAASAKIKKRAVLEIVENHQDVRIVFPVHLNPKVQRTVHGLLGGNARIRLMEPLGYRGFAGLLARSHIVLTDSGGIQEEAPSLGKPVLELRNETERQEGVDAGTCRLVGTDCRCIVKEVDSLLTDSEAYARMARAVNPYGDGQAAQRIVACILKRQRQLATV